MQSYIFLPVLCLVPFLFPRIRLPAIHVFHTLQKFPVRTFLRRPETSQFQYRYLHSVSRFFRPYPANNHCPVQQHQTSRSFPKHQHLTYQISQQLYSVQYPTFPIFQNHPCTGYQYHIDQSYALRFLRQIHQFPSQMPYGIPELSFHCILPF